MQPTYEPRSARCAGVKASSATMSLMPMRPPGRSTRAISRKTAGLSAARLTTQLLITTSIEPAGSGIASIWPLRNSTLVAPASSALRRARVEHLIGHVEPERPARRVPPAWPRGARRSRRPSPRSSTRSPSWRSATAVGLPQPSEASTAASGSSSRSRALYRPAPMPSSGPQQAPGSWRGLCGCGGISLANHLVDLIGHRSLLHAQPTWTRPDRLAPSPAQRRAKSADSE